MMLPKWDSLPEYMKNDAVKKYYDILSKKRVYLFFKRLFDITASTVMLVVFSPVIALLAVAIKLDSPGPVFYRQLRVTRCGKTFRIHKFRSMVTDADRLRSLTVSGDERITKTGKFIRKYRIDEISQLIDIFQGNMTFVGTRPEIEKFVAAYTPEMYATLLLPAGVTSAASICYKDESLLLGSADGNSADRIYIEKILPRKMEYNLTELTKMSAFYDIATMLKTVLAVSGKTFKVKTPEENKIKESV